MTMKVDPTGRIVLPKPIRDRYGLTRGAALDLRETREGLLLTPVHRQPALVRRGKFLVHTATLSDGMTIPQAVEQDREERDRKLGGL
jgi:AbrB family looped-hinge helix DNA binding protein